MCFIVLSCRGVLWLAVGTVALVLQIYGIMSPLWLIAPPNSGEKNGNYTPAKGVLSRCIELDQNQTQCIAAIFYDFGTAADVYPNVWKASFFFLAMCATLHSLTLVVGVLSCCLQDICRKSVISLAGAAQALAGVLGVIGFLLFPWHWRSEQDMCGPDAEPFLPANCSIGCGVYASGAGVALTFLASGASRAADRVADSDRLRRRLERGHKLVCVV